MNGTRERPFFGVPEAKNGTSKESSAAIRSPPAPILNTRLRSVTLDPMSVEPNHRIDLLEARMNTLQARYRVALVLVMAAIVGMAAVILGVLIAVLAVS